MPRCEGGKLQVNRRFHTASASSLSNAPLTAHRSLLKAHGSQPVALLPYKPLNTLTCVSHQERLFYSTQTSQTHAEAYTAIACMQPSGLQARAKQVQSLRRLREKQSPARKHSKRHPGGYTRVKQCVRLCKSAQSA